MIISHVIYSRNKIPSSRKNNIAVSPHFYYSPATVHDQDRLIPLSINKIPSRVHTYSYYGTSRRLLRMRGVSLEMKWYYYSSGSNQLVTLHPWSHRSCIPSTYSNYYKSDKLGRREMSSKWFNHFIIELWKLHQSVWNHFCSEISSPSSTKNKLSSKLKFLLSLVEKYND